MTARKPAERRWRTDGGDYMTGDQIVDMTTPSGQRGTGALVMWWKDGTYSVSAWTRGKIVNYARRRPLREAKQIAQEWIRRNA